MYRERFELCGSLAAVGALTHYVTLANDGVLTHDDSVTFDCALAYMARKLF